MKFPHDDRLRDWLSQLCDSLEGHDPGAMVIVTVSLDTNTMAYSIDATYPGPEGDERSRIWLEAATRILIHDAHTRKHFPERGN